MSDIPIIENIDNPLSKSAWFKFGRLPKEGETVYHKIHNGERMVVTAMTVTRVEVLGRNGKAGVAVGTVRGDNLRVEYNLRDLYPTLEPWEKVENNA